MMKSETSKRKKTEEGRGGEGRGGTHYNMLSSGEHEDQKEDENKQSESAPRRRRSLRRGQVARAEGLYIQGGELAKPHSLLWQIPREGMLCSLLLFSSFVLSMSMC